ncbi:bifunctional indole-3-glycerol-phosphate synthase TrpC/phosphoribosylanthranilate isomerase TrpF [Proteus sp. G2609]|uniref:bifunctional indole-3-glycerol-phosphate synthase TrpC/phosphoribosylanthranilate isomerase TrpF n=1 Tax=Proteus TaxID=583 RepID=UPI0013778ACC|nr:MULTISPECIES: bifunctional indole-3-glycerol-phosphate synthase TrpC/phosphoribosylanthranilate isomerase TrpF [Proteus]MDM3645577.1 bifunctional indole-3-glycerol-phosphate synthase TrpC/phosphoribosylanthranilate isomerase TrpF [Proteus mirabilis]NBN66158.1 bifunctional indole-3-glycerol-phosphate synthase TrpC/phosphoribosylanthranilate isomerase TrpF [Proteus sp. G2609]HAU5556975.1 bifunctional indole-3-glycerol-phosphate synthase TrpC/phosphoribosylanthranilate isomerase TrpF [Proteus mi
MTVLNAIVKDKAEYLVARKAQQPLSTFIDKIAPSTRSFYQALTQSHPVFILECKKASPSKGIIRSDFDPVAIAKIYQPYAAAISVLTDEKYFQGSFDYLRQVSDAVHQPVLCKDFIIDEYQIYLARFYQADAILLMLSVLNDEQYRALSAVAYQLNMGVLTEVSTEEERQRAIELKAKVIGINNRNLRDLSIDLSRTEQLSQGLPQEAIVISESGIHTHQQVKTLSQYANGFLVGSALMSQENIAQAVRALVLGKHKVCGLTRTQDVKAAYQAGAYYGGLIFAEKSPRRVTLSQAQLLVTQAPLAFVGVFQNQSIELICDYAKQLNLSAVQLHGAEDAQFIAQLREKIAPQCEIWQALNMAYHHDIQHIAQVNKYVLDNGTGGTGNTFDWQTIPPTLRHKALLAGGLNSDNCLDALNTGCLGLDFNSGVESSAGIKDPQRLSQVFTQLQQSKFSQNF